MNLDVVQALQRIAVALFIGLLIGVDRERTELRGRTMLFAGVRTFPLIALAGAIAMLLRDWVGPVLLVASFLAIAAISIVAYVRSSAVGEVGATTEVAAVATFLLGALAGAGQLVVAGAAGVAVAVLLVSKSPIERFSRALAPEELVAALELAAVSVIVLPILPQQGYGPWEIFNPFEIWLVVVLVTALSFAGFIAMRLLGERRGLTVTGLIGGLVSSTAVTLAMAERSRESATQGRSFAAAAVLASTVMCVRIAVVGAIVNAGILPRLAPILGVMAVTCVVASWLLQHGRTHGASKKMAAKNPFSLRRAVTFAVIYAAVKFMVRAAQEYSGNTGVFVAAGLSGLADVDAPTIAFARLGALPDGWRTPATAIAIAAIANTLVKIGLAVGLGSGSFRRNVAMALGASAVAGAVAAAIGYVG